jgi:hypothetical protein
VALRVATAFVWPTINDVRTGGTPEYPDLRPQRFDQPYERVFPAALATARDIGLEITAQSAEKGEIAAVATTQVFRFKDDVTIAIARQGSGTTVNMRSHSRIGKGDLGANARRIREFQAQLAKRL